MFKKSIFTAASPNTQIDDVLLTLKNLVTPWSWYSDTKVHRFAKELSEYTSFKYIHTIDSGRSALHVALHSIEIGEGDEVLMPSFTCVVVANAVSWTGATPRYLDTSQEDFNSDYSQIESLIGPKTKAIIVQHTFGKVADVQTIKKKLEKLGRNDIYILEDFAHMIHRNMDLRGDIGFLTFGIEKVISTVRGGAIVTNDKKLSGQIQIYSEGLPKFPRSKLLISLMNPIFWWIAIPLHSVGIGRFTVGAFIRGIWRKLGFLGIMVESSENMGEKPDWFPVRLAGALAELGSRQLSKLDYYNEHRSQIARIYNEKLSAYSDKATAADFDPKRVYLRYPILLPDQESYQRVWDTARGGRVTLGNWFQKPLYGSEVGSYTYQKLCYIPAETPITLEKCATVLNLPTSVNISPKRARQLTDKIAPLLNSYIESNPR